MERKLYRSRTERMVAGVCGGIAEYYGVDPTLIRLLAVLATVVSFGGALVAYLIMSIVVPESPDPGATQEVGPMPEVSGGTSGDPGAHATPTLPATPPAPSPAGPPPATAPPGGGVAGSGRRERPGGSIVFGAVLVFFGLALLASQFVPGLDLWRLWPLAIIAIGISIMFRGGRR